MNILSDESCFWILSVLGTTVGIPVFLFLLNIFITGTIRYLLLLSISTSRLHMQRYPYFLKRISFLITDNYWTLNLRDGALAYDDCIRI
jgi:hypothetical protein